MDHKNDPPVIRFTEGDQGSVDLGEMNDYKSGRSPKTRARFGTIPTLILTPPDDDDDREDEDEGKDADDVYKTQHIDAEVTLSSPEQSNGDTEKISKETELSPPRSPGILRRRTPESNNLVARAERTAKTTSQYMVPPSRLQERFLKSIKRKHVLEVEKSLHDNPGENLHLFTDSFGVSALRQSVETGTPEMVDVLINRCNSDEEKLEVIHHAILFAIHDNLLDMVKHLLNRGQQIRQHARSGSQVSTNTVRRFDEFFEDAEYSVKVKPIVLASQLERHEIIDLLLDNNCADGIHPLTLPCKKKEQKSDCTICKSRKTFTGLRTLEQSEELIEIYKGLSSPAYMWKTELEDPICEAFNLSGEMDKLQDEDPPFKDEYEQISLKCRFFARDMLALCRNSQEVTTLLSRRDPHDKLGYVQFPMIMEALRFNQQEFIAHPKCQSVLQNAWFEGLPEFWVKSSHQHILFALYCILWLFCFPVLCVLSMVQVCKPVTEHMQQPIGRFLSDTVSFFIFLVLIVVDAGLTAHARDVPSKLPSVVQWFIVLWILGMTCRFIKVVFLKGKLSSRNREWSEHIYFMLMLSAFSIYIVLRAVGTIVDRASSGGATLRQDMGAFHPLLLSECAYSVGCVLAFCRLTTLFKASNSMGPLQISLGRMTWDIIRFMLIFFIVITAFVIGITKLYSAYAGYVRLGYDEESGRTSVIQPEQLTTLKNTYKTLFWSLFGYGTEEYADMMVKNNNMNDTDVQHKFSEITGYTLLGAYHVVAIIVLLNMLIAMMANSYNVIERNADVEWKFARTRLRMNYFNEVGAVPPPFNLIPVKAIWWLIGVIRQKCGRKVPPFPDPSWKQSSATRPEAYSNLMQCLNKRYWNQRRKKEKARFVTIDQYKKLMDQIDGHLSLGSASYT